MKLLEAAERLFAEHGFDVVSVRDITQAVKGNVAAVNYHFGSRDALVNLVMSRYLGPINAERLVLLEALEARGGRGDDVAAVVEALVRPVVDRMLESKMSEVMYCRLVGRAFGAMGEVPAEIERQWCEVLVRMKRLLSRAFPAMADEELLWQIHFVVGGMLHMLTHREQLNRLSDGMAGQPDLETTVKRLVRFAVAGLGSGAAGFAEHQVAASASSGVEPMVATVVIGQVRPDAQNPEPEISAPEPEISEPEPEISATEPEISAPEPEISDSEPEISEPELKVSEPDPEVSSPKADEGDGVVEQGTADVKPPRKRAKKGADDGPQGLFSF